MDAASRPLPFIGQRYCLLGCATATRGPAVPAQHRPQWVLRAAANHRVGHLCSEV